MSVQAIASVNGQQQSQQPQQQDIQPKLEHVQIMPEFHPMESAEGAKAISEEALVKNIENLNRILTAKNTSVAMEYDSLTSPKQVAIVDTESGRVIREMPPQAAVEIAEKARDYVLGLIIDKTV